MASIFLCKVTKWFRPTNKLGLVTINFFVRNVSKTIPRASYTRVWTLILSMIWLFKLNFPVFELIGVVYRARARRLNGSAYQPKLQSRSALVYSKFYPALDLPTWTSQTYVNCNSSFLTFYCNLNICGRNLINFFWQTNRIIKWINLNFSDTIS